MYNAIELRRGVATGTSRLAGLAGASVDRATALRFQRRAVHTRRLNTKSKHLIYVYSTRH